MSNMGTPHRGSTIAAKIAEFRGAGQSPVRPQQREEEFWWLRAGDGASGSGPGASATPTKQQQGTAQHPGASVGLVRRAQQLEQQHDTVSARFDQSKVRGAGPSAGVHGPGPVGTSSSSSSAVTAALGRLAQQHPSLYNAIMSLDRGPDGQLSDRAMAMISAALARTGGGSQEPAAPPTPSAGAQAASAGGSVHTTYTIKPQQGAAASQQGSQGRIHAEASDESMDRVMARYRAGAAAAVADAAAPVGRKPAPVGALQVQLAAFAAAHRPGSNSGSSRGSPVCSRAGSPQKHRAVGDMAPEGTGLPPPPDGSQKLNKLYQLASMVTPTPATGNGNAGRKETGTPVGVQVGPAPDAVSMMARVPRRTTADGDNAPLATELSLSGMQVSAAVVHAAAVLAAEAEAQARQQQQEQQQQQAAEAAAAALAAQQAAWAQQQPSSVPSREEALPGPSARSSMQASSHPADGSPQRAGERGALVASSTGTAHDALNTSSLRRVQFSQADPQVRLYNVSRPGTANVNQPPPPPLGDASGTAMGQGSGSPPRPIVLMPHPGVPSRRGSPAHGSPPQPTHIFIPADPSLPPALVAVPGFEPVPHQSLSPSPTRAGRGSRSHTPSPPSDSPSPPHSRISPSPPAQQEQEAASGTGSGGGARTGSPSKQQKGGTAARLGTHGGARRTAAGRSSLDSVLSSDSEDAHTSRANLEMDLEQRAAARAAQQIEREANSYTRNRLTRLLDEVSHFRKAEGERLVREGERFKVLEELKRMNIEQLTSTLGRNSALLREINQLKELYTGSLERVQGEANESTQQVLAALQAACDQAQAVKEAVVESALKQQDDMMHMVERAAAAVPPPLPPPPSPLLNMPAQTLFGGPPAASSLVSPTWWTSLLDPAAVAALDPQVTEPTTGPAADLLAQQVAGVASAIRTSLDLGLGSNDVSVSAITRAARQVSETLDMAVREYLHNTTNVTTTTLQDPSSDQQLQLLNQPQWQGVVGTGHAPSGWPTMPASGTTAPAPAAGAAAAPVTSHLAAAGPVAQPVALAPITLPDGSQIHQPLMAWPSGVVSAAPAPSGVLPQGLGINPPQYPYPYGPGHLPGMPMPMLGTAVAPNLMAAATPGNSAAAGSAGVLPTGSRALAAAAYGMAGVNQLGAVTVPHGPAHLLAVGGAPLGAHVSGPALLNLPACMPWVPLASAPQVAGQQCAAPGWGNTASEMLLQGPLLGPAPGQGLPCRLDVQLASVVPVTHSPATAAAPAVSAAQQPNADASSNVNPVNDGAEDSSGSTSSGGEPGIGMPSALAPLADAAEELNIARRQPTAQQQRRLQRRSSVSSNEDVLRGRSAEGQERNRQQHWQHGTAPSRGGCSDDQPGRQSASSQKRGGGSSGEKSSGGNEASLVRGRRPTSSNANVQLPVSGSTPIRDPEPPASGISPTPASATSRRPMGHHAAQQSSPGMHQQGMQEADVQESVSYAENAAIPRNVDAQAAWPPLSRPATAPAQARTSTSQQRALNQQLQPPTSRPTYATPTAGYGTLATDVPGQHFMPLPPHMHVHLTRQRDSPPAHQGQLPLASSSMPLPTEGMQMLSQYSVAPTALYASIQQQQQALGCYSQQQGGQLPVQGGYGHLFPRSPSSTFRGLPGGLGAGAAGPAFGIQQAADAYNLARRSSGVAQESAGAAGTASSAADPWALPQGGGHSNGSYTGAASVAHGQGYGYDSAQEPAGNMPNSSDGGTWSGYSHSTTTLLAQPQLHQLFAQQPQSSWQHAAVLQDPQQQLHMAAARAATSSPALYSNGASNAEVLLPQYHRPAYANNYQQLQLPAQHVPGTAANGSPNTAFHPTTFSATPITAPQYETSPYPSWAPAPGSLYNTMLPQAARADGGTSSGLQQARSTAYGTTSSSGMPRSAASDVSRGGLPMLPEAGAGGQDPGVQRAYAQTWSQLQAVYQPQP